MSLLKIANICKYLAKEFETSLEGQGYQMLLKMLEKQENLVPYTALELRDSIQKKLDEYGIINNFWRIEITVYADYITYKTYLLEESVELKNPKDFYQRCITLIEKNAEKYKDKILQENLNSNISFK